MKTLAWAAVVLVLAVLAALGFLPVERGVAGAAEQSHGVLQERGVPGLRSVEIGDHLTGGHRRNAPRRGATTYAIGQP